MKRALPLLIFLVAFISPSLAFPSGGKGLEEAAACKKCHRQIFDQWKSSRHAESFTEPIFRPIFDRISKEAPEKAVICVFCHNPAARLPEHLVGEGLPNEEGVTCDFCHTVKEVNIDGEFPKYVNTPGTKRGPVDSAKSTYHKSEFSSLHLRSKFCAGCHEFTNQYGVGILTTFSEWEKSFYKGEGIHCQYCHLPQLYKDVQYLRESEKSGEPPDHTMRGGHYPEQLKEVVKISGILKTRDNKANLELELFNDKSGHKVPTGIPTRRMVVAARIFNERGEKIGEKEDYFERVLGDQDGTPITSPVEIFLNARKVLKDNRIGPKEKRKLVFEFPLKESQKNLFASVSLFFELPSPDPTLRKVRINFNTIAIPISKREFPFAFVIILLLLITAGLISYDIIMRKGKK